MVNPTLQPGCYYGRILKNCEVGDFILTESLYEPDTKIAQHSHSQSYFCIVLQGGYRETYDRRVRDCKPSTVVFHPPGEVHEDHFCETGGRLFRLEMKQLWLERARQRGSELDGATDFAGSTIGWLSSRLYKEFYQMDPLSPMVIEGLSLEMVGEAGRMSIKLRTRRPPRWLERAKEFLHDTFHEDSSLGKIANLTGIHPVHFARVFRQFYGCSVGEYIRRLRIDYASRQLSTTDTSLAEIGAAAGFSDQSHFSKSFKLITGMTPAQYRIIFRSR